MGGNAGDSVDDVGGDDGKIRSLTWVWKFFNILPLGHLLVHAHQVYTQSIQSCVHINGMLCA